MLLVRLCRKCKKFKIVKNSKSGEAIKLLQTYNKNNMVCCCGC